MSVKAKRTRKGNASAAVAGVPLPPHEWDFAGVPKEEKEACYLYEYAREFFKSSKHLQKFYDEWQKPAEKRSGQNYIAWIKARDLLTTRCEIFPHINFENFPQIAWQNLGIWPKEAPKAAQCKLRQEASEMVNDWSNRFRKSRFSRLNMATVRQLEPSRIIDEILQPIEKSYLSPGERYAEQLLREFEPPKDHLLTIFKNQHDRPSRKVLGETEYGFFAIDWGHNDNQIKQAFKEWLDDQREERKKLGLSDKKPAKGNRGSYADRLRWLGALRVKNHYRRRSALVDGNDTNLKVDAPYCHYPDLCESAIKAEMEITRLFSDDWNESEWRRKQKERDKRPLLLPEFLK